MTENTIDYNGAPCWYKGRNGLAKQTGISMFLTYSKAIVLSPVNKKVGITGSCFIEIPVSEIDNVIELLKSLKREEQINQEAIQIENERNTNQNG